MYVGPRASVLNRSLYLQRPECLLCALSPVVIYWFCVNWL